MYYFNKCQLFCTHEQSAGGKRGSMVRMRVVYTETCKQWWLWYNWSEIEIYVRIMDCVHYYFEQKKLDLLRNEL